MQTLTAALMLAAAAATGLEPPPPVKPDVHRVQSTLKWSGSWIWTPENRKWVDKDNQSSVELLTGNNVEFCIYTTCWTATFRQKDSVYSFSINASYYEFWLGDFNSLEGRVWLDRKNRAGAPDAMIRMASQ